MTEAEAVEATLAGYDVKTCLCCQGAFVVTWQGDFCSPVCEGVHYYGVRHGKWDSAELFREEAMRLLPITHHPVGNLPSGPL